MLNDISRKYHGYLMLNPSMKGKSNWTVKTRFAGNYFQHTKV